MPELRAALAGAGVPVDILAFDACNMGDVEVAWDVASVEDPAAPGTPLVDYLVASEETIDQDGYPYDDMFAPLAADPGRSPRAGERTTCCAAGTRTTALCAASTG